MALSGRISYYQRVARAYLLPGTSQLTFWHDHPQVDPNFHVNRLGPYYMLFDQKADYSGFHDAAGIPMLDYHGEIGRQYNPIAIAQWGLGNYNLYRQNQDSDRRRKFLEASDWLCENLEQSKFGAWVWHHHFDWEYRSRLKAPWYSGLAQGQGISLLLRAYLDTHIHDYLKAAMYAYAAFLKPVEQGGVLYRDERGDSWIEEYIVRPPTHILNGFLWAIWGVYDYMLLTQEDSARELFIRTTRTVLNNLRRYDLGFWSLYELSGTKLPMLASPFYHRLHVVQLRIMYRLSGEENFLAYANKWEHYARSRVRRTRALFYKSAFKLCYY